MIKSMKHVEGRRKGDVELYALSTCIWCMRTKRLLDEIGVEYSYVDVDLLDEIDREKVMETIHKHNPKGGFPTLIINNDICIVGYKEIDIKKVLGNAD